MLVLFNICFSLKVFLVLTYKKLGSFRINESWGLENGNSAILLFLQIISYGRLLMLLYVFGVLPAVTVFLLIDVPVSKWITPFWIVSVC